MVQRNSIKISRLLYYLSSLVKLLFALDMRYAGLLVQKTLVFRHPATMRLNVHALLDFLIAKEVILDREYESGGVALTYSDKVIVDIGAGFGDFVISVAKRFPKATMFAFEIDSVYLSLLGKNIEANGVTTIHVINKPAISIKQVLKHAGGRIDFLKIDCEGCEYSLFSNITARDLRSIHKISMEYHEFGGKTKEHIIAPLKNAGFELWQKPIVPSLGTGHISGVNPFF